MGTSGGFASLKSIRGGVDIISRRTGRVYNLQSIAGEHVVSGVDLLIYTDSRHRAMDLIEVTDSQILIQK